MIKRDVIVRAYGDEPVRLLALSLKRIGKNNERIVVVVGRAQEAPNIGFPIDSVFEWDEAVFATLRAAFDQGQKERLAEAWRLAPRFRPGGGPTRDPEMRVLTAKPKNGSRQSPTIANQEPK